METKKKPIRRFREYNEVWVQRKLGEMMDVTSVKRIHQSDWTDSGVRFLRARDIVAESKNEEITEPLFISQEKYDEYSAISGKVKPGDILVTGVGTIGVPMLITDHEPVYFKDGNIIWFKNDKVDGKFLYYSFTGNAIQKYIKESAGIGTVGTYTIDSGKNTPIVLPTQKEEQEKIGEYFSNLDNLIALHQRKYDKFQSLKKAYLSEMFPLPGEKRPRRRFAGFTGDWEQRKLGNLAEVKDSARIPNDEWTESGVPYIRASDISNDDLSGVLFISKDKYEFYKERTGAPNKNDVLFNGGGEIGKAVLKEDDSPVYVQGGAVLYVRTSESEHLRGDYLVSYFSTKSAEQYIEVASAGGTMKHYTLKPAQNMPVVFPGAEEQEKIGAYFTELDNLIALHQRKLAKLQALKKAYLTEMFP